MPRLLAALFVIVLFIAGCSGGGRSDEAGQFLGTPVPQPESVDEFAVGRPLNRSGVGDVERVFARYAETRAEVIALFQAQPWYQDGLTRDEELFIERGITFMARYDGPRTAEISERMVVEKLYRYEKLSLSQGELELLVIHEAGQDAARQMDLITHLIPALEAVIGVPYPEKVMTFVNGDFDINDFNDGEFIRIDRCCVYNEFILAHELAHTYWSVAASWFNEGMADLTAVMMIEELNEAGADGWRPVSMNLESYIAARQREAAHFDFKLLPSRLAVEGLYQVADVFLSDIREIIGAEDFRAATRRVYLLSDYSRVNVNDFRIQQTFLQFAEGSEQDRIKALFNRHIWGDDGQRYEELLERDQSP